MSSEALSEMTCQEFVELVTDLIEDQLADARRVEAEVHLDECAGCERYLEQIEQTIAGLRQLSAGDDYPRSREQALAAFRELKG